jgi:tetratricopeptide (TPR) repeat protein
MDSQEIRTALGELQEDPDRKEAWQNLADAVGKKGGDLPQSDALRLLARARRAHAGRGEVEAVAQLLGIEASVAKQTPDELPLVVEQARVLKEDLFDEEGALVVTLRVLELSPDDPNASSAMAESEEKRGRWRELAQTYLDEASSAPDDVYKSSMLMRAAEMELRFAGKDSNAERVVERLEEAISLDPGNERAEKMLERIYRRGESYADVARVLGQVVVHVQEAGARAAAAVRLARVQALRLKDPKAATSVYERLLKDQPGHPEATSYLADQYSRTENWDALVALFERQVPETEQTKADRVGDMLQIGMIHWRKRERLQDAEPWFERIRKMEPANQARGSEGRAEGHRAVQEPAAAEPRRRGLARATEGALQEDAGLQRARRAPSPAARAHGRGGHREAARDLARSRVALSQRHQERNGSRIGAKPDLADQRQ